MMVEYFKPWHWKAGYVTLAIAGALLAVWCRSQSTADRFLVPYIAPQLRFTSTYEGVDCEYAIGERRPFTAFAWERLSRQTIERDADIRRMNIEIVKRRHPELFHRRGLPGLSVETFIGERRLRVSYWWFITPLMLLSAVLLLSRMRRKTVSGG